MLTLHNSGRGRSKNQIFRHNESQDTHTRASKYKKPKIALLITFQIKARDCGHISRLSAFPVKFHSAPAILLTPVLRSLIRPSLRSGTEFSHFRRRAGKRVQIADDPAGTATAAYTCPGAFYHRSLRCLANGVLLRCYIAFNLNFASYLGDKFPPYGVHVSACVCMCVLHNTVTRVLLGENLMGR